MSKNEGPKCAGSFALRGQWGLAGLRFELPKGLSAACSTLSRICEEIWAFTTEIEEEEKPT